MMNNFKKFMAQKGVKELLKKPAPIKSNLQIFKKYIPKAHAVSNYFKQFESITGPLTHYDPQGYARSSDGKYWDFTHDSWAKGGTSVRIGGDPVQFLRQPGDDQFFDFKAYQNNESSNQ